VLLIAHQGELKVSGGLHFPYASGFDYQVAYAPVDHISSFASFQFDRGSGGNYGEVPSLPDYNNRFFEIGLGYFDSVHWGRYEANLQAGFGTGSDHKTDMHSTIDSRTSTTETDTTTLRVFRVGIQQNISTIIGRGFDIGFGLGLGYEHLYHLDRTATNYHELNTNITDTAIAISSVSETSSQSTFYAEPMLLFCLPGFPISFDGTDVCTVKIIVEVWRSFRTNPYPAFAGGNGSLTLSLDF